MRLGSSLTAVVLSAFASSAFAWTIPGTKVEITLTARDQCFHRTYGATQAALDAANAQGATFAGCQVHVHEQIRSALEGRSRALTQATGPASAAVKAWLQHLRDLKDHKRAGEPIEVAYGALVAKLRAKQAQIAATLPTLYATVVAAQNDASACTKLRGVCADARGRAAKAPSKADRASLKMAVTQCFAAARACSETVRLRAAAKRTACYAILASGAYMPGGHGKVVRRYKDGLSENDALEGAVGGLAVTAARRYQVFASEKKTPSAWTVEDHAFGLAFDLDCSHWRDKARRIPWQVIRIMEASGEFKWAENDSMRCHFGYVASPCDGARKPKATAWRLADERKRFERVLGPKARARAATLASGIKAAAKAMVEHVAKLHMDIDFDAAPISAAIAKNPAGWLERARTKCLAGWKALSPEDVEAFRACLATAPSGGPAPSPTPAKKKDGRTRRAASK